jgi:hypothetical protein
MTLNKTRNLLHAGTSKHYQNIVVRKIDRKEPDYLMMTLPNLPTCNLFNDFI